MKTLTPILLCSTLALVAASPWFAKKESYDDNDKGNAAGDYFDKAAVEAAMKAYHRFDSEAKLAQVKEVTASKLCQSATVNHDDISHVLHICPDSEDSQGNVNQDLCYRAVSPLVACCPLPTTGASPFQQVSYDFGSQSAAGAVEFYDISSNSRGACYRFVDTKADIKSCCDPPRCENVDCNDNKEPNGSCKAGFQSSEPGASDCCDCLPRHYRNPETKACDPICSANCNGSTTEQNGCSRCSPGYQPPLCCDCADGFVENEQNVCEKPCEGVIEGSCTDGICQCMPEYVGPRCCNCRVGLRSISACDIRGDCQCQPGFKQPCCECEDGYYLNENNECVRPRCETGVPNVQECTNGQCTCRAGFIVEPDCCHCANGTDRSTCDSNGRCQCKNGYQAPGCCECEDGYYKNANGDCVRPRCETGVPNVRECTNGQCTCRAGFIVEPDCCHCEKGTDRSTCDSNGRCQCKNGYKEPECCECADNFEEKNGVCTSPCIEAREIYFAIDVINSHSSPRHHCDLTYTMELLVNEVQNADFELVLFPHATTPVADNISMPLFNVGASCTEMMGKLITLTEGVYDHARRYVNNYRAAAIPIARANRLSLRQVRLENFGIRLGSLMGPFSQWFNLGQDPWFNRTTPIRSSARDQYILPTRRYPAKAISRIHSDILTRNKDIGKVVILFVTGELEEFKERNEREIEQEEFERTGKKNKYGLLSRLSDDLVQRRNTDLAIKNLLASQDNVDVIIPFHLHSDAGQETRDWLQRINNTERVHVIAQTTIQQLSINLVNTMRREGYLCNAEAEKILTTLDKPSNVAEQCACLIGRYEARRSTSRSVNNDKCEPAQLRCDNSWIAGHNPYDAFYENSNPWYKDYPTRATPPSRAAVVESDESHHGGRDYLEKEILAAVEEVLEERLKHKY